MTNKLIGLAFVAAFIALAPLVAAEADQGNETRPDDAAWVEDCPPDMMCAFSDTGEDNVSRGPEDCENCRFGPDDCIECSGLPMPADNTTWGTDCPPGVYCMYDGAPSDDRVTPSDEDSEPAAAEAGFAGFAFLGALGLVLAAFVAATRRA